MGNVAWTPRRRVVDEAFRKRPTDPKLKGLKECPAQKAVPADLDTATIYVRPAVLVKLLPEIAEKGCKDLWLNPGTSSDTVLAEVKRLRLNAIEGCSILAIGQSPYAAD